MKLEEAFQLLNLNSDEVTLIDIKNAYRKYALLYHPDKCHGDTTQFQKIKEAYQVASQFKDGKNRCFLIDEFKAGYQEFEKNRPVQQSNNRFNLSEFNQEFEQKKTTEPVSSEINPISGRSKGLTSASMFEQTERETTVDGQADSPVDKLEQLPHYQQSLVECYQENGKDEFLAKFNQEFEKINSEKNKTSLVPLKGNCFPSPFQPI